MHFQVFVALVAAACLVRAQFPDVPSCATSCFLNALEDDGCSGLTNFTCHCAVPNLVDDITPCVQGACDLSDQSSVSNAVTAVCSSVGISISIPPVSSATTTGSTVSTTSTGTGRPSSTVTTSTATTTAGTGTGTTTRSGCRTTNATSSSLTNSTGSIFSFTGSSSSGVSFSEFSNTASTSATRSTSRTPSTSSRVPESTGGVAPVSVPQLGAGIAAAVGIAFMVVLY